MKYNDSKSQRITGRHKESMALCNGMEGKSILDVGCYNGWFELFATERGCSMAVGIDVSKDYLDLAKKDVSVAHFLQASGLALPFRKGSFDDAVAFELIEHLPKGKELMFLYEIRRVMKSHGRFVLSTPYQCILSNLLDPVWILGHRHYGRQQLSRLLGRAVFRIIKIKQKGGLYEVISMLLFYPFKHLWGREIPFKSFFEKKRDQEYLKKSSGWATIFVTAEKVNRKHVAQDEG